MVNIPFGDVRTPVGFGVDLRGAFTELPVDPVHGGVSFGDGPFLPLVAASLALFPDAEPSHSIRVADAPQLLECAAKRRFGSRGLRMGRPP